MLDTIKEKLDSVGATTPSKLYTPFTLFCIFFSIYFNADHLGQIFLSNNWEIQKTALQVLADRSFTRWLIFVCEVVGYSLGMIFIYGIAQAIAAMLWGWADWANTSLSAMSNRSKYVAKEEFEKVVADSNELRRKERELYTRIASYHTWKPEDIDDLQKQLIDSQSSYAAALEKQDTFDATNKSLAKDNEDKLEEIVLAKQDMYKYKKQRDSILKICKFFMGFGAVFKKFEAIRQAETNSGDYRCALSEKSFKNLVISFELHVQLSDLLNDYDCNYKALAKDGKYERKIPIEDHNYTLGASLAVISLMQIADIGLSSGELDNNQSSHTLLREFKDGGMLLREYLNSFTEDEITGWPLSKG